MTRTLAVIAMLGLAGAARAASPSPVISVALLLRQQELELGATGTYQLYDGPRRDPGLVLSAAERVHVTALAGGLRYLGHTSSAVALVPALGAHLTVNGRAYRGRLDVRADGRGAFSVINVLELEAYLHGVVRAEMPASSPLEALEAQAVASRTYALKHRDTFRDQGYGLTCDEQSQVYGGVAEEDPRTSAAVHRTRGLVMSWQGELIEASFHASCGGQTENNEDVWALRPLSYQRAVGCLGCRRVSPPAWSTRLDLNVVAARLRRAGFGVGRIRGIWALPSSTGRVREIVLQSERGTLRVPGNAFRLAVDRRQVKSMVWNLEAIALAAIGTAAGPGSDAGHGPVQTLTISGRGAGHGLGLCQHGAGVIAGMGATYADILKAYYTGAQLARAY